MQEQTGWILLLIIGIMLMIIGIQGNLGVLFAILFCPAYVEVDENG